MYFKDFKCNDCGHVEEVSKARIMDDFIYTECVKCKSKDVAMVFNVGATDVCEGMAGNASTGYRTGIVYNPSKFGRFSGTRVK